MAVAVERHSYNGHLQTENTDLLQLGNMAINYLGQLVTPDGIYAAMEERLHNPFGRDSYITADFVNEADNHVDIRDIWRTTKTAVFRFWDFQREDGKLRHEIRKFDWGEMQRSRSFFYREGKYMVNDDSVDSTPLALIVTPEFIENEEEFENFLPRAVKALFWMATNMDENNGWLSYRYNKNGLTHQGWMDSKYGVTNRDGTLPQDPIALVEAQAYAWKTMRLWSDLLKDKIPDISQDLSRRAQELKQRFNKEFLMQDDKGLYFAHALDGRGNQIRSVSINPGLCLWASYKGESIIGQEHISAVVDRLMSPDFFDEAAGIKTFEAGQKMFDPEDPAYHNGKNVHWPHATAMVAKGMLSLGFAQEANMVIGANLVPIKIFGSFVEQFSKNGTYSLFRNGDSDGSCRNQAWNIAGSLWEIGYLSSLKEAPMIA